MGREPLVTVLVTSFNYARFLGEAIDSALAQRYPRLEVVVVDDGSTDGSREVIARYGDRLLPVLKANGGQASALNAGFAAASGDVVLTLDADDRLAEDAVSRVAAAWRPGVAKVHYRLRAVDARGRATGPILPERRVPLPAGDLRPEVLERFVYPTPPTSGNAYGRTEIAPLLPIPERDWALTADAYLASCLPFHGRVAAIDAPLADYRVHGGNGHTIRDMDFGRLAVEVAHARRREALVRRTAESFGFAAADHLALRDAWCAAARLALRVSGAEGHPVPEEGRFFLASRGIAAVCRHRYGGRARRAGLAAWFALMPFLPPGPAHRLARAAFSRRHADLFAGVGRGAA